VYDQSDVIADPHRPEVLVFGLFELVEAHAGIGRIELQVERRSFDSLLFITSQTGEAFSESVGDEKYHLSQPGLAGTKQVSTTDDTTGANV
jgi:hypothetical protein